MPNVQKNQYAEVSHNPNMNNQEGFRSQMQEQKSQVGTLSSAIDHFVPRHGELRSWAIPLL